MTHPVDIAFFTCYCDICPTVALAYKAQNVYTDGTQNTSALIAQYDDQLFTTDSFPLEIILYFNERPTTAQTTTYGDQSDILTDTSILEVYHNGPQSATAAASEGQTMFTTRYPSEFKVSYNVPSTAAQTFIANGSDTVDTSTFIMWRKYYAGS